MIPSFRLSILVLLCAGFSALSGIAVAQPANVETMAGKGISQGLIPPVTTIDDNDDRPLGEDTHPMVRLTPDKSELIRLDQDAESVVVGNPEHLGVLMDNRRLLILVPRQPGATYLTVLDGKGNVIMQRHVLVAVSGTDYVRIRRSCSADAVSKGCQTTSVYYCPGMCHDVGIVTGTDSGDIEPLPPAPVSSDVEAGSLDDVGADEPMPDAEPSSDVVDEGDDSGDPAE